MHSIQLRPRSYGKQYGLVKLLVAAIMVTLAWASVAGPDRAWAQRAVKIVVFGDSLSAGYGLPASSSFPSRLNESLKAKGHSVEIANAGVSGDTTSAGLARVEWSIPEGTDAVIVELGPNDFLRGVDPAITLKSLDGILSKLKARNIPVLLCGFTSGKNLGPEYEKAFNAIFPALASRYGAIYFPGFLEGVAGDRRLNQGDGIHPNAEGVDIIVRRILPKAEQLIARVRGS